MEQKNLKQLLEHTLVLTGNVLLSTMTNTSNTIPNDQTSFKTIAFKVPEELPFSLELKNPKGQSIAKTELQTLPSLPINATEQTQNYIILKKIITNTEPITVLKSVPNTEIPIVILNSYSDRVKPHAITLESKSHSPRKMVYFLPQGLAGIYTVCLKFSDGKFKTIDLINIVNVEASIGKGNLSRGETTSLHLKVTGLEDCPFSPIQMELVNKTPSIIQLENGNQQLLPIAQSGKMESTIESSCSMRSIAASTSSLDVACFDEISSACAVASSHRLSSARFPMRTCYHVGDPADGSGVLGRRRAQTVRRFDTLLKSHDPIATTRTAPIRCADDAAPVERVVVADAEQPREDPVADQSSQQTQPRRRDPRLPAAQFTERVVRYQCPSDRSAHESQQQRRQQTSDVHVSSDSCSSGRHLGSVLFASIPPDGPGRLPLRPAPVGSGSRSPDHPSTASEEVGEHRAVETRREVPVGIVAEVERRTEEPVVTDEEVRGPPDAPSQAVLVIATYGVLHRLAGSLLRRRGGERPRSSPVRRDRRRRHRVRTVPNATPC